MDRARADRELKSLARAVLRGRRRPVGPQTTTLVHEAYLRLVGADADDWNDRRHFYAVAARAMRFVLVDDARRRLSVKRGAGRAGVTLGDDLGTRRRRGLMERDERFRLDRLLLTAAALEPGARTAFLDGLPPGDTEVAEEVRRRLRAADDLPEGFLHTPATGLLEAACAEPETDEAPPPDGGERYEIGECLGAGGMAHVYRAFDRRLGRPVALKVLQALHQIGDVRMRRGDLTGAEAPLRESLALARELAARHPDDLAHLFGLGQSEFWAGFALWEQGELEAARRHFEAYRGIAERLVALAPGNLDYRLELAYSHGNLGFVSREQGRLAGALAHFRRALEIDRRLVAEAPDPETADRWRFELAALHNAVGDVLEEMGRLDEARKHFEADLALRHELVAHDPRNQRWREFLGTSHQYLGALLLARGDLGAARPHLEASAEVFDELAARDPDNGDWRYKQAWSQLRIGRLERAEGRREAGLAAWRRADGIARGLLEADQPAGRRGGIPFVAGLLSARFVEPPADADRRPREVSRDPDVHAVASGRRRSTR